MASKKDLCVRYRARESNMCTCPVDVERMRIFNRKQETLPSIPPCMSNYTRLKELFLEDSGVSDIANLSNLPSMEHLVLDHNELHDIRPLLTLANLKKLNIWANPTMKGHPSTRFVVNSLISTGIEVQVRKEDY